jgi:type VI protein secretion system component Hcp
MKKGLLMCLTAALLSSQAISAHAAIFLQIPGMQGEVTESNHVGWIELQSLSFGHGEPPPGATVKVQFGRVNMTKTMEGLSAALASLAASSQAISQLKVEITRPTEATAPVVFKMKLTGARLTSFASSAQGSAQGLAVESLGWSFDTITWISFKRNQQGQVVPGTSACVDLAKISPCQVTY